VAVRLDIGAGKARVVGWIAWDMQDGHRAEDLSDWPDGSVDEIRASHVLEHIPHVQTAAVLAEWFRAMRPGGTVKIAVPDLDYLTSQYDGEITPLWEGWLLGMKPESFDAHRAVFNDSKLGQLLEAAGFEDVRAWRSDRNDCTILPCSLNIQCSKPTGEPRVDPAPPATTAEALQAAVDRFPYWYHAIELPYGVTTPGMLPIDVGHYRIPDRLDGLTVLDCGTWDGFWAFEAVKRGAKRVLAIDNWSDSLGRDKQHPRFRTFDFARQALGISPAVCDRVRMDVYDADQLPMFDIVFAFGLLYHMRHPLLAIERLRTVCRQTMYVETAILDHYSPYRGGFGHGYPGGQHVMEFYHEDQYGGNPTNWWVPTLRCLVQMLVAGGFEAASAWPLTEDVPKQLSMCRGYAAAYTSTPDELKAWARDHQESTDAQA